MVKLKFLVGVLCLITGSLSAKLNVPTVLLPLFTNFAPNFTLEVTEGGCYTWSSLRLNIVRLQCLDADPELGCCSRVVVSSGIKELRRNTDTVLAEEVHSGEVLRCEVILDIINNLHIVTTTREILLDESPETFEVRASDDQGNEFSTLEGVDFDWSFRSIGGANKSGESTVVRYIPFGETTYETPRSIEPLEKMGLKGHTILLEGRQTGAATVTVRLPQPEYGDVAAAGVQLLVVTNLIVTPKDATIMVYDNLKYRLQQCQQRQMNEILFPSAQYHLNSEDGSVDVDPDTGIAMGKKLGRARLVLVDRNVGGAPDVKPATAYLTVATPHELTLDVLPYRKWSVVVGQEYDIIAELFDAESKLFQLGNAAVLDIRVDQDYFQVKNRPKNGSFVHGIPLKTGRTEVVGELRGVRKPTGQVQPLALLTSVAELHIYEGIRVRPDTIILPWDPVARARYDIPLSATGGDGSYTWSSVRSNVAVVTQRGVVKTLEQGVTNITAKMTSNPSIQGHAMVRVLPPVALDILDTPLEGEIGQPISVFIVMSAAVDGKQIPFTHCEALPLNITFSEDSIVFVSINATTKKDNACAVITVTGKSAGTSQITVSYGDISTSATIASYTPLVPLNPETGETLLAVGTSRLIIFTGGPRSWTMKPSENFHSLHNPDWENEKIIVEELITRGLAVQKHIYAFRVSCRQLSITKLTLQVVNTVVGSNSKPSTATASVTVTCGKPKFLSLTPALKNLPKCPLHAEEIVALQNKDVEIEVSVKDNQGRKFDNVTSLELLWTFSKPTLRQQFKTLQAVTIEEEGFIFPGSYIQKVTPLGRSGMVDVHARVIGYDQEIMFAHSLTPEHPAFPELSPTGELKTPDIHASLSVQIVEGIQLSPNSTDIFAGGDDIREVRVLHGSGHFEIVANISGIVGIKRIRRTLQLSATSVGHVLMAVKDICLDSEPVHLMVQVYRVGSISLDVIQFIEKGKSDRARAVLFDHEGGNLKSTVDPKALKLETVPGSDHISIGPDTIPQPGEVIFSVRGVNIGQTSLSVTAADVSSPTVTIQVFSPLRLHPRNVTLLVGASLQLSALDGPPGALLEWSVDETGIARVASDGVVSGLQIGTSTITVKAITVRKHTGQREVTSQDRVEVRVVPLKGVSIHAPIIKIVAGGKMPLRAAAPAGTSSPLHLSLSPPLHFTWSLSQDSNAQIRSPLQALGLNVRDIDMIGVQFHALKPGRVTVSLSVQVPGVVAGLSHPIEYTDSINIQILPDIGLSSPRQMQLEHLLVSTQASTELRTTRDVRRFQVTVLRGGPEVVQVTQDGILTTGDSIGSAVVAFGPPDKPWRHLIVYVKPIEYVMLTAVPHWRFREQDPISVLPNGLDLDFTVSFHDDEGNQFDAVRSNIMAQPEHKGLVSITRGAENGSLTVNILESGTTSVRVWDNRLAHKPSDFLHIRSGDVLFPTNARISIGDVVCLRMPVVTNEDGGAAWNVDDPSKLRLWPDLGVAVACGTKGKASISHRASPRLRSYIEVLPLHRIELLPHDSLLTTAPDAIVDYPLLLSAVGETNKHNNLIANNRTCDGNIPSDFAPSCYPFICQLNFNNPAASHDITHMFHVAPAFNLDTGLYSCRVHSIGKASPTSATLGETIVLTALSNDGSIQSRSALLPFAPALYLHHTELKFTYTKPRQVFTVSGLPDVFNQMKIVTDKHLVTVTLTNQMETMRTYMVAVDSTWWTLDEPPPLTVVLWSPKTLQKLQLQLRCAGHRVTAEEASSLVPWLVALAALLVAVLAIFCISRPGERSIVNTTESAFLKSPTPVPNQTMLSHIHNSSASSSEYSPRRPFEDYPVYGSPWRRPVNS